MGWRAASVGILLAAVFATPTLAGGDSDDAQFEIGTSFQTPSRNIYCSYYSAGGMPGEPDHDKGSEMHCVRLKPTPIVVVLTGTGKLTINRSPKKNEIEANYATEFGSVLQYGKSSKDGLHHCTSRPTGVTCLVNGKGFNLSKSGVSAIK